jgi:hypothetical protein
MKRRSSSSSLTEDKDLFFEEQIFVPAQEVISNSKSEISKAELD